MQERLGGRCDILHPWVSCRSLLLFCFPDSTRFTASNDVSSRAAQLAQSQWCYSKSFDGACPIGPAFLHKDQVKDISQLQIRGVLNGTVVQKSGLE